MIHRLSSKKLFAAILTFAFCLNLSFAQKNDVTIKSIWREYSFFPASIDEIRSTNDGEHYCILENRNKTIAKYAYKTGQQVEVLLKVEDLKNPDIANFEDYQLSSDEKKILFYTNRERIYRRSFFADYYVYDLESKKLTKVSEDGREQIAELSPQGDKVAYVKDNNIYYKDLTNGKTTQVTTDGKFNHIINGLPDWVYEEEFSFNKAYHWSPDGKYIAYIKFDESKVKSFSIPIYQGAYPQNKANELYPEVYTFKYPKAGEDNSIVSVHAYALDNKNTKTIDIGTETDIYIPRIRWTQSSEKLAVLRMNRLQNKLEILTANPTSGKTEVLYTEENKYYIHEGNFDNLKFLDDGKHFVITSEADGYCHLYLYDMTGKLVNQLTKGNWEVTEFYGFDKKAKKFYYQAAAVSPMQREVYSVKMNGKSTQKLSTLAGTNNAEFSKGFKYYINTFSSVKQPPVYTLYNIKGKQIKVLQDNKAFTERINTYNHSTKEFIDVKTEKGINLNGWILKPYNFDPNKKYPVLVTQYSGPNSQQVLDSWSFGWEQALANKGYIVACVDPRGTGARGQEFCKVTYQQLGKYETIDLVDFAKWLGAKDFVDADRIGIWGWSYGGFMTLNCMTKGNGIFKAGISVAPVTNWIYYDNIYTERFMRKPQDNKSGYFDNSPLPYAKDLQGKLLICHGTADDNVHIQNAWEMIEALVQADKQFDMHFYTNRNHSIYGGNTRYHLFSKFVDFLETNLK